MTGYFDFAHKTRIHNNTAIHHKDDSVDNYTTIILAILEIIFGVVFIISAVVGFFNMYKLVNLYHVRKQRLVEYYALLVAKKNELDYVTSPVYKEQRLRNIFGAYKPGEKLVIFTGEVKVGTPSFKDRETKPAVLWRNLLLYGVVSVYK